MKDDRKQTVRFLDLALDAEVGNSTDKHILLHMARKGNTSGLCWLSIGNLSKAACTSRSTVERSLRRLKECGWIADISHEHPTRMTKTYTLNLGREPVSKTDQFDVSTHVNQLAEPPHSDVQNLKNPKIESKELCRSENLLKSQRRNKEAVPAGTLISLILRRLR